MEQELEINRKRAELEKAEKELELKELEEKKRSIIEDEDKRIERRLSTLDNDEEDDDYEKIETNSH